MPRRTKRQKQCAPAVAVGAAEIRRRQRQKKDVQDYLNELVEKSEEYGPSSLSNPNGRVRTVEENKMLIQAVIAEYKYQVRFAEVTGDPFLMNFSLPGVLKQVSINFTTNYSDVKALVEKYYSDGKILNKADTNTKRGFGKAELNKLRTKISVYNLAKCMNYIDEKHSKGTTVRIKMLQMYLKNHCDVKVSTMTISRLFKKCGFRYKSPKKQQRTLDAERINFIRGYLVQFADATRKEEEGTHICVYMDESFIHTNHCIRKGFYKEDQKANRSNSKGRRLVILHAITRDAPLSSLEIRRPLTQPLIGCPQPCLKTPSASCGFPSKRVAKGLGSHDQTYSPSQAQQV